MDVGPNNQFMIRTPSGAKLIVHNSGFGLSAGGFINTMKTQWNVDIDPQIAEVGIAAYRETHQEVVRLWRKVEECAIAAVQNPNQTFTYRQFRFIKPAKRDFLYIFLPSSRYLCFPFPKVQPTRTSWGATKNALTFKTWDNTWIRTSTYGGRLTENLTQATARDIMAYGMYECELAGHPVSFTVHDELIIELDKDSALETQPKIRRILETSPDWATGLPIEVEDGISTRYKK